MKYIQVRVQPKAKMDRVKRLKDKIYQVKTRMPAEKGKANKAVSELLADYFGVDKSKIGIVNGHTSRIKLVKIDDDGI